MYDKIHYNRKKKKRKSHYVQTHLEKSASLKLPSQVSVPERPCSFLTHNSFLIVMVLSVQYITTNAILSFTMQ